MPAGRPAGEILAEAWDLLPADPGPSPIARFEGALYALWAAGAVSDRAMEGWLIRLANERAGTESTVRAIHEAGT